MVHPRSPLLLLTQPDGTSENSNQRSLKYLCVLRLMQLFTVVCFDMPSRLVHWMPLGEHALAFASAFEVVCVLK
jgi:hypothetical protein